MSGDHGQLAVSAGGKHKRALIAAFAMTAFFMVVEAVAGLLAGSLALISDAGHMFTDVLGQGMALAAIQFAQSRRSASQTYGLYRIEVLAALANALLLFGVAAYVLYQAYVRLSEPPDVPGLPLLVVAVLGLVVNLISFQLLRAGASESLNIKGAFLEVAADAIGSFGVILAAIILLTTGWPYADPLIGAGIGLFILPRTWRLGRGAVRILLEIAPPEIDVPEVERRLGEVDGVEAVHDLHIWTLTSGVTAASAHLTLEEPGRLAEALRSATELLERDYDIGHATLQCEPNGFREKAPPV